MGLGFLWRSRDRAGRWVALLLGGLIAAVGCEDDPRPAPPPPAPTTNLEVSVTFDSELAKTSTASLHLWALVVRGDKEDVTCATLISGDHDPYDVTFNRLADVVELDIDANVVAEEIGVGKAFIYVEGVSFVGVSELAGCVELELTSPSTTGAVTLATAGVHDCADPSTEDGDKCDDGSYCTVGETCDGGQCGDGGPRNCTHLADGCNAEACNETDGCTSNPLPDTTPCQDGLSCTQGDTCSAGECVGGASDCPNQAPPCQEAIACSELSGCEFGPLPDDTPCDDGAFCTDGDTCQSGFCVAGPPRDCRVTQCTGTCDEINDVCDASGFVPLLTSCVSGCTATADTCDGAGKCGNVINENCSGSDVDECNIGECVENGLTVQCETTIQQGATCLTTGMCDAGGVCQGGT